MVSEWKGFPQRVGRSTGRPGCWTRPGPAESDGGVAAARRRAALRGAILPQHFPAFDALQLRLMQSVYSPQVDQNTTIERIRWGKVYGDLPELAAVIANSTSRSPLFLPDAGARLALATALCALFRTTFPPSEGRSPKRPGSFGSTGRSRRCTRNSPTLWSPPPDGNPGRPAAGRRHGPEGGAEALPRR